MFDDFAYFTIRVRLVASDDAGPTISGIIEDLATGQKHGFETGDELLRLVHTRGRAHPSTPLNAPHD